MPNFETWWVQYNEVQGVEPIFPRLEKLSIRHCTSLTALPKASIIKKTSSGVRVVNTVWRSAFPELKELGLYELSTFQRWEAVQDEEVTFPRLEKLVIESCPKLSSLPEARTLSELKILHGSQQMLVKAASYITASLSRLELCIYDNSLIQLVDGEEKQNHNKSPSPLTVMRLSGCNVFFSQSSALALWPCLVQLEDLQIQYCDALFHWPEEVFQSLVSLRSLTIFGCNNLTGRRHASSEQSTPEQRSVLLPRLESLEIARCACLVEVPTSVLPASLKSLTIHKCPQLKSIVFSKQLHTSMMMVSAQGVAAAQDDKSALIAGSCSSSDATASTPVPKLSSSTKDHCLESLKIDHCDGLSEVLDLPPSIKTLDIQSCSNLQALSGQLDAVQELSILYCSSLKSLEPFLGELAMLEKLRLCNCESLVSLPNGPQYSSLSHITILSCPGIKLLPQSLQQRLGDLKDKDKCLDARYEDPNSWKYAIKRHFCA